MGELHENKVEISKKDRSPLQKEIVAYKQLLKEYNITFSDLTNSCPKNVDKRQDAIKVAKLISENNHLSNNIKEKKQLPVKELQKVTSCCHKTISKYKKYIIALSLIYIGEFTHMKDYINL